MISCDFRSLKRAGRHAPAATILLFAGSAGLAETSPAPRPGDIIVNGGTGKGALDRTIEPILHVDADGIRALGVTSVADLLTRLGAQAKGPDGATPVLALNGRRPLNDDELQSLPFEAFQSFDLLPPEAAAKLGYPPNQPVLNFVTKPRFRALEMQAGGKTTTDGGGGTKEAETNFTRLQGKRRLTVTGTVTFQSELRQDKRSLAPDPSIPYDAVGNVTGVDGGEIDPGLSALAGSRVTVAAVPADPAARDTLSGYLATANEPRMTDLGRYRSLQPHQRTLKLSGFYSQPVGSALVGTLNISAQQQRSWSLQGLGTASLLVPAGTGSSPFGTDVILNRYLTEAPPLRQHGTTLALHAGAGLIGRTAGWNWSLRLNADRKHADSTSDLGIDTSALSASVAQGAEAFDGFSPALLTNRLTNRSRSTITTWDAQLVVDGYAASLPAGPLSLTATLDAQKAGTRSASSSIAGSDVSLGRNQGGGTVTATIPIASRADRVLSFLGVLSAELSGGASAVSRYGALYTSHYGLTWTPVKHLQFLATLKNADVAPALDLLAGARIATPNTPFVDLVSGESAIVTSVSGGNPDLAPEKRHSLTLTADARPLGNKGLDVSVSYERATIRDQAGTLSTVTPAIETAFPDRFVRDASGQLAIVDLRSLNFSSEWQRTVKASLSFSGPLGPKPAAKPAGAPAQPRTYLYASLTPAYRLEDRLLLQPGAAALDLLHGDSIASTGGRPRWDVQGEIGVYRGGLGLFASSVWHSGSRARNDIPTADLHYASLGTTSLFAYVELDELTHKAHWAHQLRFDLSVQNIANARPRVHDRTGQTPNSDQPAYLDPLGRVVSLRLRKLF